MLAPWIFSVCTAVTSLSSLVIFGLSWWPLLFLAIAAFVSLSLFFKPLGYIAILLARISGVLALMGLALLMLAATVGGSFHLSPSNWLMAGLMLTMAISGLSAFFWQHVEAQSEQE